MSNSTNISLDCSEIVDAIHPDNSNNDQLPIEVLRAKIDCQVDAFTRSLLPFIGLVQGLLNYGTTIIVCLGLFFNTVSFIVLTRKKMRRSSANMFLSILAVYDTLSLTLNFMIGVIRGQNLSANQSFMDNQSLCKLHGVFVVVFNLLSVWTIVTFTIVRFLIVKFPLKAKNFTQMRTLIIIVSTSLVVVVFSCHKIFITGFEGDSVFGYKGCQTDRARIPDIGKFYVAFNTWLPTVLVVIFNLAIVREIKIHTARRQTMTTSTSRSDEKATRLLLTVSFAYLVLVSPLGIIQTIELFWNENVQATPLTSPHYADNMIVKINLKWIRAFCFFFYQINFAINFFLYAFSSSGTMFQNTLRQLMGFKKKETSDITQRTVTTTVSSNAVMPLPQPEAEERNATEGQ
ncbi:probable G-protein coupled receptor 139 [Liolophura sinensis]|uniref:probable G-protein coupled receptor 139 n=1 Tax=Liolophura sinensis TaxID=3198878 RepID=UPI00315983E5